MAQLLAVIGDQFQVGDEICGVVCSIRYGEDILSVWNRNPDNSQANLKIKYFLKKNIILFTFKSTRSE